MILILGGTTEGRAAIQVVDEAGKPFYYATRFGEQQIEAKNGIRIDGGLDCAEMRSFIQEHDIRLLIDAAHPFASQLHSNATKAADATSIPIIRYERNYPLRNPKLVYCSDYEDAIRCLLRDRISKLLALTGVQTISKLKPYWENHPNTIFRILDRESSRQSAISQGFPIDRICYFVGGAETERELMEHIRPEAIITKESGESGFFSDKVSTALNLGIRVYVVCRPKLPDSYALVVEGPIGLRLAIDRLLPSFFDQHIGLTTGTFATAATKAALLYRMYGKIYREVSVALPKTGERILVRIDRVESDGLTVRATAFKDGGDDPDTTHGTPIVAQIHLSNEENRILPVNIDGGEGIGRITLPGFDLPIGSAAINTTPRLMIMQEVTALLPGRAVDVLISVPHGRDIGPRTFNPRLGIENGISIIGTTGVVRPFSSEAFVASIERAVDIALAVGGDTIVINSGGKSEYKMKEMYPHLPPHSFVQYGNFIGKTLEMLNRRNVPHIVMGIMIGKAVKLAEGQLDTHSHKVVMNRNFLLNLAQEAGCSAEACNLISQMNLARQVLSDLNKEDSEKMSAAILNHCYQVCKALIPNAHFDIHLVKD